MKTRVTQDSEPTIRLSRLLARARRYWRGRRTAEGLLAALALVLGLALAAIVLMDLSKFDSDTVSAARYATLAVAALLFAMLVLVPALRSADDGAIARYLEKQNPALDALLLSAVEAGGGPRQRARAGASRSEVLSRRLLDRAVAAGSRSLEAASQDRPRLGRALGAILALLGVVAGMGLWGPDWLRHGMSLMMASSADARVGNPYSVQVQPGDVEITRGADLKVSATTHGFTPTGVVLVTRTVGEERWTRRAMQPSGDAESFETFLFNLDVATEYSVVAEGVESEHFQVDVRPRPEVRRLDLVYHFPPRTGRPSRRIMDGGDISAVVGTRVDIEVLTSLPLEGAELVLNGVKRLPLQRAGDGWLSTLEIRDSGHYRIDLPNGDGGMLTATPEYVIVALEDREPSVSIDSPARDIHVTSVEEIEVQVRAEDDVAVRGLELLVSVNGGPEETLELARGQSPDPVRAGGHVFFLENRELAPGDLIAYYARAWDSEEPSRRVTTDIYFMDVRPYDQSFRSARGGGGGAGGGRNEQNLTAQQRALVVALFNFVRDRQLMDQADLDEGTETLMDAQERIRSRVEAISRRLNARSIVEMNPGYQTMAKELPRASAAMLRAEALLAAQELDGALPEARSALLHLQRADAAVRDVSVAQARGGGGQGGDLTNLFRLELDKLRSQYAEVNRGAAQSDRAELDETMRKLQELARRQQREMERARRRAEQGRPGSDSQRELAGELEKLVRELERLTRKRQSAGLQQSLQQLRGAAEQMRQAAAGEGGGAAEQEALRRLQQARRMLVENGRARTSGAIDGALEQAESIAREHRAVGRDLDDLKSGIGTEEETVSRILRRKGRMVVQTEDLESELARLAQETRSSQPRAADKLREALAGMRESTLISRIERSGRRLVRDPDRYKPVHEEAISREVEQLKNRISAAATAVEEPVNARADRSMESLRGLIRELDGERRRSLEQARRGGGATGSANGAGGRGQRVDGNGIGFDPAQAGRWSAERAEMLASIARGLPASPKLAADINSLIEALRRDAVLPWDTVDPDQYARIQADRLQHLQSIERELRGELVEERPPPLATIRAEPSPAERELVETYYRNLSEHWQGDSAM